MIDPAPLPGPLAALRRRLVGHALPTAIHDIASLRLFVQSHVFSVLDFMSLLKSLQLELTGCRVPWTPAGDPEAARLVLEIVLCEEADELADGRFASHYESYLEAMEEAGADTAPVRAFARDLEAGIDPLEATNRPEIPAESAAFLRTTFALLREPLHARAAAFLHGREDVLPALFLPIVRRLAERGLPCTTLRAYLERHVEVDSGDHAPRARALIRRLCAGQRAREVEATDAARRALEARLALWDGIRARIADGARSSAPLYAAPGG